MYRRIRDLREDGDLLQRDLAGYLGIAQTTYSNYEIGEREIPISVLTAVIGAPFFIILMRKTGGWQL